MEGFIFGILLYLGKFVNVSKKLTRRSGLITLQKCLWKLNA